MSFRRARIISGDLFLAIYLWATAAQCPGGGFVLISIWVEFEAYHRRTMSTPRH